jgi:hypothetical protein
VEINTDGVDGLESAKPGRRNIKGETDWVVEIPAHPAPIDKSTDPSAMHFKMEKAFTRQNLRAVLNLRNPNSVTALRGNPLQMLRIGTQVAV